MQQEIEKRPVAVVAVARSQHPRRVECTVQYLFCLSSPMRFSAEDLARATLNRSGSRFTTLKTAVSDTSRLANENT